jgi:hypothetical protein
MYIRKVINCIKVFNKLLNRSLSKSIVHMYIRKVMNCITTFNTSLNSNTKFIVHIYIRKESKTTV